MPQARTIKEAEIGLGLFDIAADRRETTNQADQHPEVVERLKALAEKARSDLGDSATKRSGSGVREPGHLPEAGAAPGSTAAAQATFVYQDMD